MASNNFTPVPKCRCGNDAGRGQRLCGQCRHTHLVKKTQVEDEKKQQRRNDWIDDQMRKEGYDI